MRSVCDISLLIANAPNCTSMFGIPFTDVQFEADYSFQIVCDALHVATLIWYEAVSVEML